MGVFADLAQRYHSTGATVLPIIPGTKCPPAGVVWAQWQDHLQTADEVVQLVAAHPTADIALLCGRPSGGLVDIETDGPDGEAALRALGLSLPPTASSASPRGQHRFYRSPVQLRSRLALRRHLDLLADGRYVVVPPSSGRWWLTPAGLAEVAPLPDAWREFLTREDTGERAQVAGPNLRVVERAGTGAVEGFRNTALASQVGSWITQGLSEDRIKAQALTYARRCTPPLEHTEALTVVESVLRSRRRTRSPEREALMLSVARDLRHPAHTVLVGLVGLWGELGLTGPSLHAPDRLLMRYAGNMSFDGVHTGLAQLERASLVAISWDRDPRGRRVRVVTFLPLCWQSISSVVLF